jgi:hypothetical protein
MPHDVKQKTYTNQVKGVTSRFTVTINANDGFGTLYTKHQLSRPEPNDESDFFMDEDLFDEIADDEAPGLGILVRTDFSNDEAWRSFLAKLKEGEEEFSSSTGPEGDVEMDQDEPSNLSRLRLLPLLMSRQTTVKKTRTVHQTKAQDQ